MTVTKCSMTDLDALLARRGELLAELEIVNQQIGVAHSIKQCAVCRDPISAERQQAQPRAVTCSNRECGQEHQRRLARVGAQRQRERAKLPA